MSNPVDAAPKRAALRDKTWRRDVVVVCMESPDYLDKMDKTGGEKNMNYCVCILVVANIVFDKENPDFP
jgi:hypothetical protein